MVAAAAGAVTASAVVAGGDGRGKSVLPLRRPISELAEVSSVVRHAMVLVRERTAF